MAGIELNIAKKLLSLGEPVYKILHIPTARILLNDYRTVYTPFLFGTKTEAEDFLTKSLIFYNSKTNKLVFYENAYEIYLYSSEIYSKGYERLLPEEFDVISTDDEDI